MKYKIIDPKGLSVDGVLHERGKEIDGDPKMPHIKTALHFRQIKATQLATAEKPKGEETAKSK